MVVIFVTQLFIHALNSDDNLVFSQALLIRFLLFSLLSNSHAVQDKGELEGSILDAFITTSGSAMA